MSLRSPQSGKRVREIPDFSWKYRTAFLIPKSAIMASASNGAARLMRCRENQPNSPPLYAAAAPGSLKSSLSK